MAALSFLITQLSHLPNRASDEQTTPNNRSARRSRDRRPRAAACVQRTLRMSREHIFTVANSLGPAISAWRPLALRTAV